MLSFRQKVFTGYLIAYLILIALMFPIAKQSVSSIISIAMEHRADELISKIQTAPNNVALVRRLKDQKSLIFFRVGIISDEHKVLYDTHTKHILGLKFNQNYVIDHPEVNEAFEKGLGYHEEYSELLGQKFAYMAKTFDFHGKTYVIRTAFPYKYVADFTRDFEIAFVFLASLVLLLFSAMTWFIIHQLTRPIRQIITAVKPYQSGEESSIPHITLKNTNPHDDFSKLANTLNSLTDKIQRYIDNLIAERNEKEAVLEALIEGVVAVDSTLKIVYANQTALKFLGFTKDQLLQQDFHVTKLQKCIDLLQQCQLEDRAITDTMQIRTLSNQRLFLDIVAAPIGKDFGAILVLQDKSAHYKLIEIKKDFVANASHELKTPVTIIQGFAETLHDHPELPQTMTLEITEKIMRNCIRMSTLIKNLLRLADIENLNLSQMSDCDIPEILSRCKENLLQIYPNANVIIQSSDHVYMQAEPDLVELAIMNLLLNAAKYSLGPAEITIDISKNERWITIAVSDKGIGIPEDDLEYIFQRFYTVNKARSQKLGGSGLGLAIVETIMEKHGGRATVMSTLDKGSTFTLFFPNRE